MKKTTYIILFLLGSFISTFSLAATCHFYKKESKELKHYHALKGANSKKLGIADPWEKFHGNVLFLAENDPFCSSMGCWSHARSMEKLNHSGINRVTISGLDVKEAVIVNDKIFAIPLDNSRLPFAQLNTDSNDIIIMKQGLCRCGKINSTCGGIDVSPGTSHLSAFLKEVARILNKKSSASYALLDGLHVASYGESLEYKKPFYRQLELSTIAAEEAFPTVQFNLLYLRTTAFESLLYDLNFLKGYYKYDVDLQKITLDHLAGSTNDELVKFLNSPEIKDNKWKWGKNLFDAQGNFIPYDDDFLAIELMMKNLHEEGVSSESMGINLDSCHH